MSRVREEVSLRSKFKIPHAYSTSLTLLKSKFTYTYQYTQSVFLTCCKAKNFQIQPQKKLERVAHIFERVREKMTASSGRRRSSRVVASSASAVPSRRRPPPVLAASSTKVLKKGKTVKKSTVAQKVTSSLDSIETPNILSSSRGLKNNKKRNYLDNDSSLRSSPTSTIETTTGGGRRLSAAHVLKDDDFENDYSKKETKTNKKARKTTGEETTSDKKKEEEDQGSIILNEKNEGGRELFLTAYEKEREIRLQKNRARMEALNIRQLASEMMTTTERQQRGTTGPSQRGLRKKEKKAKEPVVLRRSGRRTGGVAELAGGIDQERRDGSIVLADGRMITQGSGGLETRDAEKKKGAGEAILSLTVTANEKTKTVKVELSSKFISKCESTKGDDESDAKFIEYLHRTTRGIKTTKTKTNTTSLKSLLSAKTLDLKEDDVAKCTERAVTHADFHPSTSEIILASGDKDGNVSLWRVDDEDEDTHGVYCFKPHSQYVSHVKFGNGNGIIGSNLLSCAYDGHVWMLDSERGEFLELFSGAEHDIEFASMETNVDGNVIYGGDNDGMLNLIDLRASTKKLAAQFALGEKRINTVSFNTNDLCSIATSSAMRKGGGEICVWDLRKVCGISSSTKQQKPVHQLLHKKSTQSAYWNPDGKRLLTTCYDDCVRVWNPSVSSTKPEVSIRHNTQTGRWVLPFRAKWVGDDGIAVGSMKREVEIFDAQSGKRSLRLHSPELMTAIPSRVAVHPTANIVAGCTSSGRCHIYR